MIFRVFLGRLVIISVLFCSILTIATSPAFATNACYDNNSMCIDASITETHTSHFLDSMKYGFDEGVKDCEYCNLKNIDLSKRDLRNSSLRYSKMNNINLSGANLSSAILDHAVLMNADLRGADLSNASLEETYLNGANLKGATVSRNQLEYATLYGTTLPDGRVVDSLPYDMP